MSKKSRGRLDRRIRVLRAGSDLDELGKEIPSEELEYLRAAAKYMPVSDRERLTHQLTATLKARFRIRWNARASGITTDDVLEFDGERFGILAIKEIGRRKFLEITAVTNET